MNDIKNNIELDAEDIKALKDMNDKQIAVQQFMQTIQQQGEQRLQQLQSEGRDAWTRIANKHGLDLERVNYTLNNEGTKLVATSVRLADQ